MGCLGIDEKIWYWPLGDMFGGGEEPSPSPTESTQQPRRDIVAQDTPTRRKKRRFGTAQRPEDLGILKLSKAGKLGQYDEFYG